MREVLGVTVRGRCEFVDSWGGWKIGCEWMGGYSLEDESLGGLGERGYRRLLRKDRSV